MDGGLRATAGRRKILRIEAYHKRGSRLHRIPQLEGVRRCVPETDEDRMLVYPEASTSRGVEVYGSRDLGRRFSVRGSYALSFVDGGEPGGRGQRPDTAGVRPDTPRSGGSAPRAQSRSHLQAITQLGGRRASLAFHTGWPATLERQIPVTGPGGQPRHGHQAGNALREPAALPSATGCAHHETYRAPCGSSSRSSISQTTATCRLLRFSAFVTLAGRSPCSAIPRLGSRFCRRSASAGARLSDLGCVATRLVTSLTGFRRGP